MSNILQYSKTSFLICLKWFRAIGIISRYGLLVCLPLTYSDLSHDTCVCFQKARRVLCLFCKICFHV